VSTAQYAVRPASLVAASLVAASLVAASLVVASLVAASLVALVQADWAASIDLHKS
jgi:hypothetical protein